MQRNWIGKSTGANLTFTIDGTEDTITVYTTRPDTAYGVSFMVLAPESPLVKELVAGTEYEAPVDELLVRVQGLT